MKNKSFKKTRLFSIHSIARKLVAKWGNEFMAKFGLTYKDAFKSAWQIWLNPDLD
jgi:hypothetical protein